MPPSHGLTFQVITGPARGQVIHVESITMGTMGGAPGGTVSLGRSKANHVVVDDARVADEHAQIFREDGQYILRDLTLLGATRVRRGEGEVVLRTGGREAELALRNGDLIQLGDAGDPLVLACRIGSTDSANANGDAEDGDAAPDAPEWIKAKRAFTDFPRVADAVTRDTGIARKLLEVTQKLAHRFVDLAAVFDGIADAVFELVPLATHISIALADLSDGPSKMTTVFARSKGPRGAVDADSSAIIRTSGQLISRVQRERDAISVADAKREIGSDSIMAGKIESTMAVPLWDGDLMRGVIQVDNRANSGFFEQRDLDLLVALAGQATLLVENARLFGRLKTAEEKLQREVKYLKNREETRRTNEIVGDSQAMRDIFRQIDKVKDTKATVCIEGETGTGKELIASAVHYQGNRRDKLFVAQNCAAVPENLLESELFGHKKGAFTGADHEKKGLFEIADGGTLFLDEIAEMSIGLQAKLLRVLQEGKLRPVGATVEKAIDVRIICATNRALEKEVDRGTFRQDLYYRLKVFPVRLPPLRERREDVPLLIEHFLRRYTQEMKKPIAGITPEAMDQLSAYAWPGNIRELDNEVQRLVIQADAEVFLTPDMLSPQIRKVEQLLGRVGPAKDRKVGNLKERIEEVERWLLTEALREHGGNKTRTAETLGMTREGLHKKLGKYGM